MKELRITGERAERLGEILDRYAPIIPARPDDLTAVTLLALLAFGDDNSHLRERFPDSSTPRWDYFSALRSFNPGVFRLIIKPGSLRLVVARRQGETAYELGTIRGYTSVIPLTRDGYTFYFEERKSQFLFEREHVAPSTEDPGRPPAFVYVQAAFRLRAMQFREPEGPTSAGEYERDPDTQCDLRDDVIVFDELSAHVARYLPQLDAIEKPPVVIAEATTGFGRLHLEQLVVMEPKGKSGDGNDIYLADMAEHKQHRPATFEALIEAFRRHQSG